MKKTLLLAVMAGAALASCVKNEPIAKGDGSPERILFDAPVVSVPTRATEIYGNYPKDKNFAVFAFYHEGNFVSYENSALFMKNVKCTAQMAAGTPVGTNTPDYWAPEADYYWPKEGKLSFVAYAPAMRTLTAEDDGTVMGVKCDDAGITCPYFEINDNPTEQIDLLYSDLVENKQSSDMLGPNNKDPYQGITIPFKHALASIVFMAKTDVETTTNVKSITLTSIKVKEVVNKIHNIKLFPEPSHDPTPYDERMDYDVFNGTKVLNTTADYVNGPVDPDVNDGVRRSDLIVIPQTICDRWNADDGTERPDVTADITYTIVYKDEKGNDVTDNIEKLDIPLDLEAVENSTKRWNAGKRYIYTITIGLNKIYFNPQVQNWEDINAPVIKI